MVPVDWRFIRHTHEHIEGYNNDITRDDLDAIDDDNG